MYLTLTEMPTSTTSTLLARLDYVQSCYARGLPAIVAYPSKQGKRLWHVTAECEASGNAVLSNEAHTAIERLFEYASKPTMKTKTRKGKEVVKEYDYYVGLLSGCPRIKQKHVGVVCAALFQIYSTSIHAIEQEPVVTDAIQASINQVGLLSDESSE